MNLIVLLAPEPTFEGVMIRVAVIGVAAMLVAGGILFAFWRSLGRESAEEPGRRSSLTFVLLGLLVLAIAMIATAFFVYSLTYR